jgi:hypothetical protein
MYSVKNISAKTVTMPKTIAEKTVQSVSGNWAPGQIDQVEDALINEYIKNSSVFTVLSKNGAVTTGVAALTGLTATDVCLDGVHHQTTFNLAAVPLTVTDALAYASQKLFDFPEGRILIEGATASLQFAVTSDRASTINDSASLTWSLGSAAASSSSLTSTMVDQLPLATKVLSASTNALNTASTNKLAASAQFDGTGTPIASYLNTAFATGTDIDADGTMTAAGTITITWTALGDY